ncbi:MAG TPA: metal ABC transporter ATP-binding protein [Candidatus Saccharimonadales bacterium]|nr:metal ABC transporter ATP-binding protein [Candidatus Saccharimonadales bacterium]
MKSSKKAPTTSASSGKTSPRLEQPSHASKVLVDVDGATVILGGQTVVKGVSFCVHAGEFIGLIGPNGAGKTTLLRVLLGLQQPASGDVRVATKKIGYIPQRAAVHNSQVPVSVLEVVSLGSATNAHQALAEVGMADMAAKPFTHLSGGQQQRVLIAKALAGEPDLLILDEPTTGIDERSQKEFYDILRRLQSKGMTLVMVSHDIEVVLQLVTRVICVNGGILYDGSVEHFEADEYLPKFYAAQHRILHHKHGAAHA